MINILIPMAGLGSRFYEGGFKNIKPLIPLNGKTFIEWSIESVDFKTIKTQFIFVILEKHRSLLKDHLLSIKEDAIICSIDKLTNGAAESCLSAKKFINNDNPLIITNSDQIFEWDKEKYINFLNRTNPDGNVITFDSSNNKFSYIILNEQNKAIKLAEKEVISNNGLVGIHYWKHGKYFVESTELLIQKNIRSNNEFYISLTYNMLIEKGLTITEYRLNNNDKYLSIGTPEQVFDYLEYKNLNIKKYKLGDFKRGWFIGDFEPSILKGTGVELGCQKYKKGEKVVFHYHENCIEINLLTKGKMKNGNIIIECGEIFVFEPYNPAIPYFLEDSEIVVFKNKPSNYDKILM